MKKILKSLVLVLGVALAVSVFAISASAIGDGYTLAIDFGGVLTETSVSELPSYSVGEYVEYKSGDFRASYRISAVSDTGNTLTVTLDTEDVRYYAIKASSGDITYVTKDIVGEGNLGEKFLADMNSKELTTGSTVKLLSDIFVDTGSVTVSGKTVYLDLNGFNLIFTNKTCTRGTAFSVKNSSNFYLYSSRTDGNLFHASPQASYEETTDITTPLKPASHAVFSLGESSKINLGAYGDASGDNLSIYANILVDANSSYGNDEYAITIDGGYYNRYSAGKMAGMFYFRDSGSLTGYFNVSAKNATFNAESRTFYCYSDTNDSVGEKLFRIDVENCVFAGGTVADREAMYEGRMQANFSNCYFLTTPGSSDIVNLNEGCHFIKEYPASLDEGFLFAKSINKKAINLKTNTFSFSKHSYDSTEKVIYADFNLSSLDVTESAQEYYFNNVSASEKNTSNITWVDLDGNSVTEAWYNGSIPSANRPLPEGNDIYYYTYGKISEANGDRTYVAKPIAKFGLKINLTLSEDLIYNVYIPEAVADGIKEVRVYNSVGEGKVLERGELATINSVPYYRYYFNIQASRAADAFSFDMDIYTDDGKTEYFTQKNEMSIPAYAAPIIYNDKYSDATHNLMNKVLAYVKAACDYFKTAGSNKYYSVIGKIPSVKEPSKYDGETVGSIPTESDVKGVLKSIAVIFGSQLKYRFYFKPDADFTNNTVKLSYVKKNGMDSIVIVTSDNINTDEVGNYYDIPLRASDMRSDVILTVNSDSFTYNLANYIAEVRTGSDTAAKNLVYSLWEYSEAASKFNNEMPDVDVRIDGTPISEYKIVANTKEEIAAAEIFKATIAKEHGIELEMLSDPEKLSDYDGKAIIFKNVSVDSDYDYIANVVDGDLVIECAFRSFFGNATEAFVNDVFCNLNRDIDVTEEQISIYNYGKILYSDFDVPTYNGTADDFKGLSNEEIKAKGAENAFSAIKYAHEVANKKGYDVYGEAGKVYYISENDMISETRADTITIKTNTYWQGASFIIDDSNISPKKNLYISKSHVFTVSSDYGRVRLTELETEMQNGFSRDIDKLNTGLDYPALLLVNNESATHYIRFSTSTGSPFSYDENGNPAGKEQHEYVIVDAEGNIDPTTPFLFDYDTVSSIYAYRIDDTPIVIDGGGGTMTTLSSNVSLEEGEKQNITRNLYVTRCNVTVKNVVHNIYNEPGETGHTYSGFFYTGNAYNVEFNNCVVQSRVRCVGGTYDIGVYDAVDVRFINCTQSNFYNEGTNYPSTDKTWYVMGSNFCKNITYDGCMLTRFDAHCGVYNATIKNSTISVLRLTGGGHFYMENTTVVAVSDTKAGFIELREDYGSTWRGTIELKDCTYVNAKATTNDTLALIRAVWVNHDFGYQTYLPNIIIDNLMLESDLSTIQNIEIFCLSNGAFLDDAVDGGTPDFEEGLSSEDYRQETLYHTDGTPKPNVNPYVAPDFILIKNNFAKKNYVAPTHVVFSETSFRELPVFDDIIDTPIIPYP